MGRREIRLRISLVLERSILFFSLWDSDIWGVKEPVVEFM